MIVGRDAQIASFRKAFFYELVAALEEGFSAKYSHQGQTRIDDKAEAERLHRELSPHRTGSVRKIEKKIRRNRPPPLYDLTNLQRDANRRFGFTAAQVLEYAQALYETHKLISYPRTESRHISEDMVPAAARHPGKAGSPPGGRGVGTAPRRAPAGQGLRRQNQADRPPCSGRRLKSGRSWSSSRQQRIGTPDASR